MTMCSMQGSRIVLAVIVALVLGAAWVEAAPPIRVSEGFDIEFPSAFWTLQCGVPVVIRMQGTQTFMFFRDRDGQVIAEIDTAPGLKTTVSSPLDSGGTGKAFTYAAATPVRIVYPDGAYEGASAIVFAPGLGGFYAPGVANAGRTVLQGIVAFLAPDGFPIVDVVGLISENGRPLDSSAAIEARCDFLTSP